MPVISSILSHLVFIALILSSLLHTCLPKLFNTHRTNYWAVIINNRVTTFSFTPLVELVGSPWGAHAVALINKSNYIWLDDDCLCNSGCGGWGKDTFWMWVIFLLKTIKLTLTQGSFNCLRVFFGSLEY